MSDQQIVLVSIYFSTEKCFILFYFLSGCSNPVSLLFFFYLIFIFKLLSDWLNDLSDCKQCFPCRFTKRAQTKHVNSWYKVLSATKACINIWWDVQAKQSQILIQSVMFYTQRMCIICYTILPCLKLLLEINVLLKVYSSLTCKLLFILH